MKTLNPYKIKWVVLISMKKNMPKSITKILSSCRLRNDMIAIPEYEYQEKKDKIFKAYKKAKTLTLISFYITDKQFGLIGKETKLSRKIETDFGVLSVTVNQMINRVVPSK